MKPLTIASGANGHPTYSLPAPDTINGVALLAGVAESITIPSGARHVIFSATDDFYARYGGTAAVITDTTDGTGSELNPVIRTLLSSDTISVIADAGCNITASFYS